MWVVECVDINIQTAICPSSCGVGVQVGFLLRAKTSENSSRMRPLVLGFLVARAKCHLLLHARVNT
jgi:hypothetical protein